MKKVNKAEWISVRILPVFFSKSLRTTDFDVSKKSLLCGGVLNDCVLTDCKSSHEFYQETIDNCPFFVDMKFSLSVSLTVILLSIYSVIVFACNNSKEKSNFIETSLPHHFLCRMCGQSLEDFASFVEIASPFSFRKKNETFVSTIKGKNIYTSVSVQELKNPAEITFEVITLKKSSCKGIGKVTDCFFEL